MIQIDKGTAPPSLVTAGTILTNNLKNDFTLNNAAYRNGTIKFAFNESAYKTADVKTALINCQHNKCCFSEAKFVNDDSHVEHFRPKGRVDEWPTGQSYYPGYYWLAYDWSNLYLCKSTTNSSVKRNFFPLYATPARNSSHHDLRVERPYLIDPGNENPRNHIHFKKEEIVGKTFRGRKTIEILKLRNSQIDESRRTKFQLLSELKTAIDLLISIGKSATDPQIIPMINLLKYAVTPEAEFSSMAIDLLSGWPHLA